MDVERMKDIAQRNIWIRGDGAIMWESILDKLIGSETRRRILTLVEDHIANEREIDWVMVWEDFSQSTVTP